jgi:hypothetical protein
MGKSIINSRMKAKEICFCKDISSVYLYLFFNGQKECQNKHCGGYATLLRNCKEIKYTELA